MLRLGLALGLLAALVPNGVFAQERDPLIGKEVVLKPSAVLLNDGKEIDPRFLDYPPTVEDADEKRVWLGRGWVNKADVMTPDAALTYCDEQLKARPTDANLWRLRGLAWMGKKEARTALYSIDEAIKLDATLAAAYLDRASVHTVKRNYATAYGAFEDAIRLDPINPIAYVRRAFC